MNKIANVGGRTRKGRGNVTNRTKKSTPPWSLGLLEKLCRRQEEDIPKLPPHMAVPARQKYIDTIAKYMLQLPKTESDVNVKADQRAVLIVGNG